jgi:solute carrier family 13 (sodium-dependent dicarboxylate transporter), member 2/3/5
MSRAKISFKTAACLFIAAGVFSVARLAPPLAGLSPLGQSVLGAAFAGTILWVSEAIPLGLTALVVLLLLGLCPSIRFPEMASGFAGEVVFFLIGAVAIGAAVETSGLAARAARFLCRSARGNPTRLYVQLIGGIPLLAFLVPSAIYSGARLS